MPKTLKFPEHFTSFILAADNGSTVRVFDDKGISLGDELLFAQRETGKIFARAIVTKVTEAPFSEITKQAKDERGMYDLYASYHGRSIDPSITAKIVSYDILERLS